MLAAFLDDLKSNQSSSLLVLIVLRFKGYLVNNFVFTSPFSQGILAFFLNLFTL